VRRSGRDYVAVQEKKKAAWLLARCGSGGRSGGRVQFIKNLSDRFFQGRGCEH